MKATRPVALRFGQAFPIGTRLHRRLDAGQLEAAEWRLSTPLEVACPGCGQVSTLGSEYHVDRAGTVSPVWSCPHERCPAMTWLELGGMEDT